MTALRERVCQLFEGEMCHPELLSLQYNYRIIVRTAMLRDCLLQNRSRFACAKGLPQLQLDCLRQ